MPANTTDIEKRLWEAADDLRANSKLKSSEYSIPVLGLIFLRYADYKFEQMVGTLQGVETLHATSLRGRRRPIGKADYQARGVLFLRAEARFAYLLQLPEGANIGAAINVAMLAVEDENEDLRGVLPQNYTAFENSLLISLLKTLNFDLSSAEGDVFGQIYEYFLGKFAMSEGQKGGEIKQGNTFYDDAHSSVGRFDFVMANPPFNVDKVDKERLKKDPRFPLGLPTIDNANYLCIQIFYSALNATGRAGFVMANSASDARGSELEVRRKLIEAGAVDVMIAVGPNMFYTVTLPCTLWFLDRAVETLQATSLQHATFPRRQDTALFIDARHIYRQIDRAHREFTAGQIAFIASLVRLYRGEDLNGYQFDPAGLNLTDAQIKILQSAFSNQQFKDVPGLCKVAALKEIEAQGWSLNPGRYVGVAEREADDFNFAGKLEELNEELETLNAEARELEERIGGNVTKLLNGLNQPRRTRSTRRKQNAR